jgi:hypothetical protein
MPTSKATDPVGTCPRIVRVGTGLDAGLGKPLLLDSDFGGRLALLPETAATVPQDVLRTAAAAHGDTW